MKNNKSDDVLDALAGEVRRDFEKRRDERKSLEMQWRLNLNYFMGNQYCEIGQNGEIEDYGKQYFWQQREVYNHTATVLETRISKLSGIKVGMSVRPLTGDEQDKQSAAFSTKILSAVFNELNLQKAISEANMWSEVTGTSFYKIVWDKDCGRRIGRNEEGDIYDGDVRVEVVPPFEVYPDSVTKIGIGAFRGCKSLASVTIPGSVTKIGDEAFLGCTGLSSVTIPRNWGIQRALNLFPTITRSGIVFGT